MIVQSSAPSRIGLFGGGSDVASYADIFGGLVINLAINLRQYVTLYTGQDLTIHPYCRFPITADKTLFYKILDHYNLGSMHHSTLASKFDGIIGAGLGSSASASVALIGAIYRSLGKEIKRDRIAMEAQYIEVSKLGWYGGKQDQLASVYGGLNLLHIGKQITVVGYDRTLGENLCSYISLFYTGGQRRSKSIQNNFKKLTKDQIKILNELKEVTIMADYAIRRESMNTIGNLLHKAWELKKLSNKGVSNSKIDGIYTFARKHGAMSGKLLGAGGSGYMMFFVSPERRGKLITKLAEIGIENVDFELDSTGLSTRVI